MPKPVCVACQRFYRPKTIGFGWIEGMPRDNALPGRAEPDKWSPYKLWNSDLWECPDCGSEIIVGHGANPISEHYLPEFADQVAVFEATLQVNDC